MAKHNVRFAPVAPIHILEDMIKDLRTFGNYHLLLAHHTVEDNNPSRFRNLFNTYDGIRSYEVSPTIIMDNSVVELGGAVDSDMIRDAVAAVGGFEHGPRQVVAVLPDVMGDGKRTIVESHEAYVKWTSEKWLRGAAKRPAFMLVTQGNSWKDFTDLVDHFFVHNNAMYPYITWVGVPRWLARPDVLGSRQRALAYLRMVLPMNVKVHLLGFSDNIWEDMEVIRLNPFVEGIDSAVPVRAQTVLTPNAPVGPRGNWWEEGSYTRLAQQNITNVRHWINRISPQVAW